MSGGEEGEVEEEDEPVGELEGEGGEVGIGGVFVVEGGREEFRGALILRVAMEEPGSSPLAARVDAGSDHDGAAVINDGQVMIAEGDAGEVVVSGVIEPGPEEEDESGQREPDKA